MKKETKAIHTPYQRRDAFDALQMPVYHTLAYEFDDAEVMADAFCGRSNAPDYSRVLNPTVTHFEERVAALTGANEVSAFSSGMAAISALLFSTASAGKNIVSSRHMFGNTYLLLTQTLANFGIEVRLCDLTDAEAVRHQVDSSTCCIYLETVTNPQLEVADVRELSKIASKYNIPVIADTTVVPFTQFDAESIGIDFQVVSTSKYVSGGATSLGGVVIDYGHFPEISKKIKKDSVFNLGAYMTPHAAYMQTLGLETLKVRYERQSDSANILARKLEQTPGVKKVGYPGLEGYPDHRLFRELYGDRYGAMLTFELADEATCKRFINSLRLIHRATNLFDNRTLAIHPASTIFGSLDAETRREMDVLDTTIRLSVGLEDPEDLYADLSQAIAKATQGNGRKYDFDTVIERRGSGAIKTDLLEERYGRPDLMAAWVADMDFATPDFILEDLRKRLDHPILGYTAEPADYRPAIIDWERKLHGWEIKPEWISYIPGIVKGIGMVINVFTKPGDSVVIMPPVYHPFRITTEENGRKVTNVPLIMDEEGKYRMDYETLENLETEGGVILLSNPHNPGGRMWTKEELQRFAEICKRKNLLVVSDEIHADLGLWGNRHIPFASVSEDAFSNSITFGAPTKTFNIPGVVTSFSVVPDDKIRERFYHWLAANEFGDAPIFSHIAAISAYRKGEEWRKEMLDYVMDNIRFIEDYIKENIPGIKALRPEASYLVWLDCRSLGLTQPELNDFFVNKAGVALNDGEMFGIEGIGFMRLNAAAPRSEIRKILESIREAAGCLNQEK